MDDSFLMDEKLSQIEPNKYLLVNIVAQRARQINDGVEVYVRKKRDHPLGIAFEEISEGHIGYDLGMTEKEIVEEDTDVDVFRFDEMIDLEGEFDLEDSEAFEIEDFDFDEDFYETEELTDE